METLGYMGAVFMGVTLGLMGGGGSILAVPILVYLFLLPGAVATYYSLFIVGLSAAVAVFPYLRRGGVELGAALGFFLPSVLGVMFSRRILLPLLPQNLIVFGYVVTKDLIILLAFGVVMITAAGSMIRKTAPRQEGVPNPGFLRASASGIAVGTVTGFVGAGGGFLIVPALVNGLGLSMQKAVGTSLLIIALNSLLGFGIDLASGISVDWVLVTRFLVAALLGVGLGVSLNRKIPSERLKPAFGWFVLIAGVLIVLKTLLSRAG